MIPTFAVATNVARPCDGPSKLQSVPQLEYSLRRGYVVAIESHFDTLPT